MRADRTAIVHFGSQIGRTLAGFIGTLYIARTLGSGVFGTYVLAIAVVAWLQIPVNAIGAAVNKRVSEGESRSEFLSAGIVLIGGLVVIINSTLLFSSKVINQFLGGQLTHLLIVLYTSRAFLSVVTDSLHGQKMVERAGILQMVEQTFRTALHIFFIVRGYSINGLFVGYIVSLLVASLLGLSMFNVGFSVPGRVQFRRLISYARYSWLGQVRARSLDWIDTLVLGFFAPASLIGIYEIAWRLASTLSILAISISNTLFPEISEINMNDDIERIRTSLSEAITFAGLFVIPGLFGTIIIGDRLLRVYGSEFAIGWIVLTFLVATRVLTSYGQLFLSVISGMNRPDKSFRISVVFLISNILMNLLFVPIIGWTGAAIATMLSAAVLLILSFRSIVDLIEWPEIPVSQIVSQVLASLVMTSVLIITRATLPPNNYVTVGLIVLGAAVYMLILLSISKQIRARLLNVFINR